MVGLHFFLFFFISSHKSAQLFSKPAGNILFISSESLEDILKHCIVLGYNDYFTMKTLTCNRMYHTSLLILLDD